MKINGKNSDAKAVYLLRERSRTLCACETQDIALPKDALTLLEIGGRNCRRLGTERIRSMRIRVLGEITTAAPAQQTCTAYR